MFSGNGSCTVDTIDDHQTILDHGHQPLEELDEVFHQGAGFYENDAPHIRVPFGKNSAEIVQRVAWKFGAA